MQEALLTDEPQEGEPLPSLAPLWKRAAVGVPAFLIAAVIWLAVLHLIFDPGLRGHLRGEPMPRLARQLAQRQIALWSDPHTRAIEIQKMRGANAEWDFMSRSFLVWALGNIALRDPSMEERCLEVMDFIIDETVRLEEEHGHFYFLMNYASATDFFVDPPRSVFVDGEIALMLGLRRLVRENEVYGAMMRERVQIMVDQMRQSEMLSAESYPFECWTFCNTVALAAIRVSDHLDGTDHSAFIADWMGMAKERLINRETGLLASYYSPADGAWYDGPEGSTLWMAAHCLALIDPEFARDQYERSRNELRRTLFGFGYADEWPASYRGAPDVDSGPYIPFLHASAGSSGLAILGAGTFGDTEYLSELIASLEMAAFPVRNHGQLSYSAAGQIGDSVILYALVCGPAWAKVRGET